MNPYGPLSSAGYQRPNMQPPRQNPKMAIRFNGHGVFGVAAIGLTVGVGFIRNWNISWWYLVLAIVGYSTAIIYLTYVEERMMSRGRKEERFDLFRFLLGCHMAFLFLVGGLWLNIDNFFVQVGIFIAAIAAGMAIPFLLLRQQ